MAKVVVFSGAGISAESGLRTFRDSDGLWEEYRIEDVATPQAWARDPRLVLRFYDLRREQVLASRPNAAHLAIAELERRCHVDVVTQNIDDLHERAGSNRVLHLHGEILKARSSVDRTHVVPVTGAALPYGALCPKGSQLRPHIVWFGEEVPLLPAAAAIVANADVLLVVGTSLQVWPAAGLVHQARPGATIILVDPKPVTTGIGGIRTIVATASEGVPAVVKELIEEFSVSR